MALLIPAFGGDAMGAARVMRNAVEAARAAGVKLIAWNSSGPMSEERTGFPMYDLRLDMVEALRQGGGEAGVIRASSVGKRSGEGELPSGGGACGAPPPEVIDMIDSPLVQLFLPQRR